jgi:Chlorophyll A-B binding protein
VCWLRILSEFSLCANSLTNAFLSLPTDPAGLTNGISQDKFDQLRIGEIKNGRAAMLAVIGYIVPEVYRFPGEIAPGIKFADIPNGIAAIEKVPALGWIQIMFLIGAIDFTGFLGSAKPQGSQYFDAGFLSFDIGTPDMDPETLKTRTENEVSNGRLAMLAFWELVRHDYQNLYNPGVEPSDHLIVSCLERFRMLFPDFSSSTGVALTPSFLLTARPSIPLRVTRPMGHDAEPAVG